MMMGHKPPKPPTYPPKSGFTPIKKPNNVTQPYYNRSRVTSGGYVYEKNDNDNNNDNDDSYAENRNESSSFSGGDSGGGGSSDSWD